uniref:Uncharacterized protein n=1 Tax=Tanacetum cinerariifolium TaxID=118510 RepID=A0A699H926_TANCI|nr:hypothetical protein [Tanacetum cinerariifolium]
MTNQEQNLPQQEQPLVAAKQVSFNLEDIILNTNNEIALLYLEHTSKEYFKSSRSNTFRNSIGAHYLPHSSEYVAPSSIDVVSSAIDSNPSQPSVSTPVDTELHKEDQQATGGPTSLRVTSEDRANPQLSTGMSALNLNEPIFSASFIIYSESASGHDVSTDSTAKVNPELYAPNDSIPPQQGMDEETKNTLYDHIFGGTNPHVLADQTKSVNKGLETVLTQPTTKKGASSTVIRADKDEASIAIHGDKEEASSIIKLKDLAKLVSQIQPGFKDLDSPEDDHVIIVDESKKDEPNAKTEDTSVPRSSSPSSLPTELKDLPSKFNKLTKEIKGLKIQVHELEIKLPKLLKEIPIKLEDITKTATSQADIMPVEGEKDTKQAIISQLFQRRAKKDAEAGKRNQKNQQPKQTTPPTTTPIITTHL